MSDHDFWRNAFLFWVYLVGFAATYMVVWEKSKKDVAMTFCLSAIWFIVYPLTAFWLFIERVTTWKD